MKTKVLFSFLLLLLFMGCTRETPAARFDYKFVNNSSYTVLIDADYAGLSHEDIYYELESGDSLSNSYNEPLLDNLFNEATTVSFTFFNNPNRCIEFTDAIVDSLNDPRSESACTFYETFTFMIDDSVFAKADTCQL